MSMMQPNCVAICLYLFSFVTLVIARKEYQYFRQKVENISEHVKNASTVSIQVPPEVRKGDFQKQEIYCGGYCGSKVNCAAFMMSEEGSCVLWLEDDSKIDNHIAVPQASLAWLNWHRVYHYIGYDGPVGSTIVDHGDHMFVDRTPVPFRAKLVSFIFDVGVIRGNLTLDVLRSVNSDKCQFDLVDFWYSTPTQLGTNEFAINDFILEEGDHIGFTYVGGNPIRSYPDTFQRYCSSSYYADYVPFYSDFYYEYYLDINSYGLEQYAFRAKIKPLKPD